MISVVVPLYNKEKAIARCIDSVLNQTFDDFECVVVDDGSSDKSASIVKKYTDKRIRYIYQDNGGVASARNKGVSLANGEWIVFLDADDFFLENALQVLLGCVQHNSVDCGAANFYVNYEKKEKFSFLKSGLVLSPFRLWYMNLFCPRTGAAIFKKEVLEKHPFKVFLCRYEDAESLFEIMRDYRFYYDTRPIMVYTDDCKGLSNFCSHPERDFVFHMKIKNKSFWEKIILLKMLREGIMGYPGERETLRSMYGSFYHLCRFEKIVNVCLRGLRNVQKNWLYLLGLKKCNL